MIPNKMLLYFIRLLEKQHNLFGQTWNVFLRQCTSIRLMKNGFDLFAAYDLFDHHLYSSHVPTIIA